MVKVILNPVIRRMSGKMGDWTYRWTHGKQTVMKTPDLSEVKWSKAQKAHRQAMADPKVCAHYKKAGKKAGSPSVWPSLISLKGRIC